jgi:hypothetical protein
MAADRWLRPRLVDTNGLLAPNFGQGRLPDNRPKSPSVSRFSIASLRPVVWITSAPSKRTREAGNEAQISFFAFSLR